MNSFLLLFQCSTQFLSANHNNQMNSLKNLTDNSWILTQQSCQQQSTPLNFQNSIASWRIESDMVFVDESNKIRYSYLLLLPSRTRQVEIQESHLHFHLRQWNWNGEIHLNQVQIQLWFLNSHLTVGNQAEEASNYIYKV